MQSNNPWSTLPSNQDIEAPGQQSSNGRLRNDDSDSFLDVGAVPGHQLGHDTESQATRVSFWARLTSKGHATVGWRKSIKALATYSWLNALLVVVPLAWAVHFVHSVSHKVVFAVSIIALLPLVKLLHYAGDQMALNCGRVAGDVVMVTVNNSVETITAILLLLKCELKLLQSTITGFVLLRLLLISGTAFVFGGLRRKSQILHADRSQLNQTMLATGALALLLPALFYNVLGHNTQATSAGTHVPNIVNEPLRQQMLDISRALSPLLLVAYICSCFYMHYPPGGEDVMFSEKDPEACVEPLAELSNEENPEVNFWASFIVMLVVGVLMAITAECLISSVQPMKARVQEEWFGLVLIPLVSFAADGVLLTVYFIRSQFRGWLGVPDKPAGSLAETRAIDLSVQFLLFWTPALVLVGWALGKPMSLLFDLFEVMLLIAACFLLNHVTFDSRTNWAEGVMLVVFYLMIIITAWFYPGRRDIRDMLACNSTLSNSTLLV